MNFDDFIDQLAAAETEESDLDSIAVAPIASHNQFTASDARRAANIYEDAKPVPKELLSEEGRALKFTDVTYRTILSALAKASTDGERHLDVAYKNSPADIGSSRITASMKYGRLYIYIPPHVSAKEGSFEFANSHEQRRFADFLAAGVASKLDADGYSIDDSGERIGDTRWYLIRW